MRRLAFGLVAGALLAGGAALTAPLAARAWLRGRGVEVASAEWTGAGMRLRGLVRGEDRAEEATLGWDRRLRLRGVTVGLPSADAGGGAGGGLPTGLRAVEVEDLTVRGLPLPTLSGELWPDRTLTGEGVEVRGDTLRAQVPTPWGTATVEATRDGDGVDLRATLNGATFRDPRLSPEPLPVPPVRVAGRWAEGRFVGTVTVGEVRARVEARGDPEQGEARFRLDGVAVADIYAIFAPLVPEAERARIEGTVDAEGTARWPPLTVDAVPSLSGLRVDGVLPPGYEEGPFRWTGRDAEGGPVLRVSGEGTPDWLPLGAMGAYLPAAVIAAEDAGFRSHRGWDLAGMLAADADNEARGEVWRGGSTLTQQLAKNLFLDPARTYQRKLRELLYAVEMEEDLGKGRILELYLNVVEWGPGLWGAKQAAWAYFLKQPAGLLPEEAAWLASILPRPRSAWTREYLADRPDQARVAAILDNMRELPEEVRAAARQRRVRFVPPPQGPQPFSARGGLPTPEGTGR